MPDLPIKISANAALEMILAHFQNRIGKKLVASDIEFLKNSLDTYSVLRCNEHIKEKGLVPAEEA